MAVRLQQSINKIAKPGNFIALYKYMVNTLSSIPFYICATRLGVMAFIALQCPTMVVAEPLANLFTLIFLKELAGL